MVSEQQRRLVTHAATGILSALLPSCSGTTPEPDTVEVSVTVGPASPSVSYTEHQRRPALTAAANETRGCCKGLNDCKGKGNCKTDNNDCKGKNECKGRGGCKSECP